ncbi:MAG: formate--tetrahydrofolate ligase [Rikenellaceae bacterium]
MKSDIEIARETPLENIANVAERVGINANEIYNFGKHIAKVPISQINEKAVKKSNLILVTAITPTKAGIGKTTVSISLALGLNKIGKKAIVALREPSLGPCFGMKGGAAGGGHAQVLPMESINIHFTGDFHAITSAHNMITALLDNYIYQNKNNCKGISEVKWKRVIDINDRSLRNIVSGLGGKADGIPTQTGFDITAASEIMAIVCFATSLDDLQSRIENILLGYTKDGAPFLVKELDVAGAITVLLKDALQPNLVQTIEHGAALVHGGPFANIAHGCNSILATKMALSHSDYAITEAGFGADLGAEKFLNIKCRRARLSPRLTVLVVTTQALKMHGGVDEKEIKAPNAEGLTRGFENLDKHITNLKNFGQSIVVALNRYGFDSDKEIELIRQHCNGLGVGFAVNDAFMKGGDGAIELAEVVVKQIETNPSESIKYTYKTADPVKTKISKIAKGIYGAKAVTYASAAEKAIKEIRLLGAEHYPICIAKTQYSFSEDPKDYNITSDFELKVRDIVINNGAEMLVVMMGEIMRMPGLPEIPNATSIKIVDGNIDGLS